MVIHITGGNAVYYFVRQLLFAVLGAAAMEKARALLLLSLGGGGKRARAVTYGGAYWYRFGVCCVCLLLAALIELWLVPQFLLLAAR